MAIDLKSFLNHAEGATGPSRLGTGDDGIEPSPACGRAFFVAGRLRHATSHIPPSVVLPCCASITLLCRRAQNSTQGVHPKNLSSPIRPNPRESINLPLQGISAPPRTIKTWPLPYTSLPGRTGPRCKMSGGCTVRTALARTHPPYQYFLFHRISCSLLSCQPRRLVFRHRGIDMLGPRANAACQVRDFIVA